MKFREGICLLGIIAGIGGVGVATQNILFTTALAFLVVGFMGWRDDEIIFWEIGQYRYPARGLKTKEDVDKVAEKLLGRTRKPNGWGSKNITGATSTMDELKRSRVRHD